MECSGGDEVRFAFGIAGEHAKSSTQFSCGLTGERDGEHMSCGGSLCVESVCDSSRQDRGFSRPCTRPYHHDASRGRDSLVLVWVEVVEQQMTLTLFTEGKRIDVVHGHAT